MLINCPRCGFQQPKDKYCAQCGVDIENYKPVAPPAWKRIATNPLIQLSLLILIAGGVGITLYEQGQQNLERRVSYLKSSVQINASRPSASPVEIPTENPARDHASQVAPTPAPENDAADGVVNAYKVSPPEEAATETQTAAHASEEKHTSKAAAKKSARLVVYYTEVDRNSLNSIYNVSRGTGQFMNFNDYAAGILPNIDKAITAAHATVLHKEERAVESPRTLQWSYGLKDRRDPSVEIGLTTFFEISEIEGPNLRGNLEIQRTWREDPVSDVTRKSFPAIFEIGGGTGFFMAGVMPPQSHLENEDELTSIDIYKILRSPRFRAGDSDFVIFIEFAKSN